MVSHAHPRAGARLGAPHRALLVMALLAAAGLAGCGGDEKPAPAPPEREKEWVPTVDGEKIMARVRRLCDIGPRPPGSPGITAAQVEIKAMLAEIGIKSSEVYEQRFTADTPEPETGGQTEFMNLIARIPGQKRTGVALAAHYDSKLFPDIRFVGANDAASAVATVIEIAAHRVAEIAATGETPEHSTWLVFFDGEEAFKPGWNDAPGHHTYGSRHLADHLEDYPFTALILLDMVGTKDILLAEDTLNSDPQLIGIFKETSREVFGLNLLARPVQVIDDHAPFKGKVPAIDLIDHAYEQSTWWHTAEDTVDILSPRSMEKVGTLVRAALPRVEKRYNR